MGVSKAESESCPRCFTLLEQLFILSSLWNPGGISVLEENESLGAPSFHWICDGEVSHENARGITGFLRELMCAICLLKYIDIGLVGNRGYL